MVKAFILIEMMAGHATNFVNSLKGRPSVTSVDRVTGPYDVIVVIESDDVDKVSDIVSDEIHSKPGVVRTLTSVSLGQ
jgi:DNA-binding Lrp family transcriptional regulator